MPASNRCHLNLAPTASRISTVESRISAPIPSPSISVTGVILMAMFPIKLFYVSHVKFRLLHESLC